jgi:hypothetical protein
MKINIIFSLCLLAMLTGCGVFSKKQSLPVISATTNRVAVEPQLLLPCLTLPDLPQNPTYEHIAQHYLQVIGLYGECALKQSASIDAIRKLANQELTQ